MSLLQPFALPGSAKNPIYVYGTKNKRHTKYIVKILFMFMEQKLNATPKIIFPKLCIIFKTRLRGGLNVASKI